MGNETPDYQAGTRGDTHYVPIDPVEYQRGQGDRAGRPIWNYGDSLLITGWRFCARQQRSAPMARIARVVVPGVPHRVTQREPIFVEDGGITVTVY